jgi:hypothetical protein
VDRGLAAVLVAMARHGEAGLTAAARAADVAQYRSRLGSISTALAERARNHTKDIDQAERDELGAAMTSRVGDLLDTWEKIAAEKVAVQAGLQYGPLEAAPRPPLLHDPLDPDLEREPPHSMLRKFKAQWSRGNFGMVCRAIRGGDERLWPIAPAGAPSRIGSRSILGGRSGRQA